MLSSIKRLTIRNLASPYGLAAVSYIFFLFAWTFPPNIYTDYLSEPDLMFLDPLTFVFFTSCLGAFLFGIRASRYLGTSTKYGSNVAISVQIRIFYMLAPLVLATLCCSIYLTLLGAKFDFVALLVSQQGQAIKEANQAGAMAFAGKWSASLMLLTSVLWWAMFRMRQLKAKGVTKILFYFFFFIGLGVDIVTCIATVDRTNLMPLLAGLLVLYLHHKSRIANVRISSLVLVGGSSLLGVVAAFLALSFLRGATALRLMVMGLLGYTVAPYNHLAALLHGLLHYSYGGRGVYLFSYFLGGGKISALLGLSEVFNWPTALGLWQSEFTSTAAAGLNPGFIWSGVFGYLYSDISWWALLYMFLAGVLAGYLWVGFNAGRTVSIVLYLWLAFWVLFWLGWNLLFDARIVTILESGIALALYDRVFVRRVHEDQLSSRSQDLARASSWNIPRLQGRDG